MKRAHRRAHALIWVLLVPALIAVVFIADGARETVPANAEPLPAEPGVLP